MKVLVGIFLLIGTGMGFNYWGAHYNPRDLNLYINGKERVVYSKSSEYLIYTNQGTFKDTDSLWYFKFSSSDLYGNLEQGKTYNCHVIGWRLPFFSEYPNIVKCGS